MQAVPYVDLATCRYLYPGVQATWLDDQGEASATATIRYRSVTYYRLTAACYAWLRFARDAAKLGMEAKTLAAGDFQGFEAAFMAVRGLAIAIHGEAALRKATAEFNPAVPLPQIPSYTAEKPLQILGEPVSPKPFEAMPEFPTPARPPRVASPEERLACAQIVTSAVKAVSAIYAPGALEWARQSGKAFLVDLAAVEDALDAAARDGLVVAAQTQARLYGAYWRRLLAAFDERLMQSAPLPPG